MLQVFLELNLNPFVTVTPGDKNHTVFLCRRFYGKSGCCWGIFFFKVHVNSICQGKYHLEYFLLCVSILNCKINFKNAFNLLILNCYGRERMRDHCIIFIDDQRSVGCKYL